MGKIIYTMGEVAEMLGESVSLVRFWTKKFPQFLSPRRNAKGNRLFSPEEVETLRQLHFLIKDKGMTLEGAAKSLAADRMKVEGRVQVLASLKEMRSRLLAIRAEI